MSSSIRSIRRLNQRLALQVALLLPTVAAFGQGSGPAPSADATPASPQPYGLPKVTVTGTPPQASDYGQPASVSTVTGAQLQDSHILSPRDFSTLVPNLMTFDANGDRIPRFESRGFRENNFSVGEPILTLYVDDVPYNDLYSRGMPLFGIDRVEVWRGPQGTLFGAGGPGGVINILTRLPDNEWHGEGRASLGNYDSQNYTAQAGGAIVKDKLFANFSGMFGRRDGFVYNETRDTHPDSRQNVAGRFQLRWTPTDRLDFTFTESLDKFRDGFVAIVPINQPNLFRVSRDFDGFDRSDSHTESLRAAFRADDFKLVSVTTHRDWRQNLLQDFDFSAVDLVRGFTTPHVKQWSQEIRVQSPDSAERFRWVVGGYFSDKDTDSNSGSRYTGLPVPFPPFYIPGPFYDRTQAKLGDQNYAIFGQATYKVVESLELTAGLRFDQNHRDMRRTHQDDTRALFFMPPIADISGKQSNNSVQPKLGLTYTVAPAISTFFSFSTGYRSGGFQFSSDNPANTTFKSEDSYHYELGVRTSWLENKLSFNASAFYVDTHDYQVYRPVTSTQFAMLNAARASTLGLEFEAVARPAEGLEFFASGAYSHARFDKFTDPLNGANFNGRAINYVPEFSGMLGTQYRHSSGLFARVESQLIGRFYYDEANTAQQKTYALLNARAGWENKNFGVYAYGRNLLDKRYFANAINFRDPQFNQDFFVGTPGDPVTIGVEVSARF